MSYRPWDREEKLGPVPEGGFKPDDPKVIAWEAAHGHDLRLKCYPEFGCLVLEAARERLQEAAALLLGCHDDGLPPHWQAWEALRVALAALDPDVAFSRTPWRYRCSLCGELLRPGPEVTAHFEHHKAQAGWTGVMSFDRVDGEVAEGQSP